MRSFAYATLVLGLFALAGCSSATDPQTTPASASPGHSRDDGTGAPTEDGGFVGEGSAGAPSSGTGTGSEPQAGQLTAGAWDDNLNFDFYLSYANEVEASGVAGLPKVPREDRLRIEVVDGAGAALGGARVIVKAGATAIFDGPTGTDGHVDVYPAWAAVAAGTKLDVSASAGSKTGTTTVTAGEHVAQLAIAGSAAAAPSALDVALVIDTTGSMGDEIAYLRTEIAAIASGVRAAWPGTTQRWAVVAYKDDGDSYVVKTSPFASEPAAVKAQIAALSADGGGDYPEAPDRALAEAAALPWATGNAARVVFWVADAPHHPGKEATILASIQAMRGKGVHVYPIAASGVDELAEYSMRATAQLTMGRYLFLTDDSGIGGAHKEPTLPCYFVTRLDKAMTRMIAMELSGSYFAPKPEDVLRTGGDPKDGRCTLEGGQQVAVF